MYYNINIRLFSSYGIENTQVEQIIHVWLAQPTLSAAHKNHRLIALFSNSKHLLHNFGVGHWPANIAWSWAKAINCICLYLTLIHKSRVN